MKDAIHGQLCHGRFLVFGNISITNEKQSKLMS